ncbi:MAG: DNA topoisomerase (ATP-hydrolyzing) subunit B [bacterium]
MVEDSSRYDASKIKVLGGIEAVRRRPSMYIGTTGKSGLHHLIYEVVDNSIDEALAGYCDEILVQINKDGSCSVTDNGRGIPVDKHKQTGKSALEVIMTTLHSGGKFDHGAYKVSGGLHGVGVSVVNALSSDCEVEVFRDEKIYSQEFKKGLPQGAVTSKADAVGTGTKEKYRTGTKVNFYPDSEIFDTTEFEFEPVMHRLKELAYLNRGIKINFKDMRGDKPKEESYKFDGGIASFVESLTSKKEPLYAKPISVSGTKEDVQIEVALQHCKDYYDENVFSYVNSIRTKEGGTHVIGFKTALTRSINNFAKRYDLIKGSDMFSGEDVREGMTAIINLRLMSPQFEGQTKTKLGNSEVRGYVDSAVDEGLTNYFEKNPAVGRAIIERAYTAYRVRDAARKAQELERKKSALETTTLPGKLSDCSERDAAKCEVFIVEGDSAGGSAKQGRDRNFQAILPLKGKILNVEKARLDKILANEEIKTMITAIGPGVVSGLKVQRKGDESEKEAELTKEEILDELRYHKIIIMTDADVDGAHIRTLLLTFFFRYARELIDYGCLYIAQPPLYSIRKGKSIVYAYNEKEMKEMVQKLGKDGVTIQRNKGLGEMNPGQLWETTMDPNQRTLLQVNLDDAEVANEIFTILMGSQVEPRRQFIVDYAKTVRWLDI